MTHKDIYTKFMIEYDKALITSSYPSLTKYEVATILDKAYLALIALKLTGNNQRGVLFEGDIKAIEDIRPLIKQDRFDYIKEGPASNERVYRIKDDMLYYIQSSLSRLNKVSAIDNKVHNSSNVLLLSHNDANSFKSTSTNLPWMPNPVSYIEGDEIHVLIDPFEDEMNGGSLELTATYIKKPAKFAFSYDDDSEGEDIDPGEDTDTWIITISGDDNVYTKTNTALYSATIVNKNGMTSRATFSIISGFEYAYITSAGKLTVKNTAIGNSGQDVIIKVTNMLDSSSFATKTINVRYYDSSDDDPVDPDDPTPIDPDADTPEAVDLGLSVKWSRWNMGANSTDELGGHYGWGDITGELTSPYSNKYAVGNKNTSIAGVAAYDIAAAKWGGHWRMPTKAEYEEMVNAATSAVWTYDESSGIKKYIAKFPNGQTLEFPFDGYYNSSLTDNFYTDHGFYWTADATSDQMPYYFHIGSPRSRSYSTGEKYIHLMIRPVYDDKPSPDVDPDEKIPPAVDLGLSVKWAKWNMGATSEYDGGGYYGWGDPTGENPSWNSWDYAYMYTQKTLNSNLDIATQKWGDGWRLPTEAEIRELMDNSTIEYPDVDGVHGYNLTCNGQTIFIPKGGYIYKGEVRRYENYSCYWTSEQDDSLHPREFVIYSKSTYDVISNTNKATHLHIRPVYDKQDSPQPVDVQYVDMGLSVLWANKNLGADNERSSGTYYSLNEIPSGYRLPTVGECIELMLHTTSTVDNGYKYKSDITNKLILIPASSNNLAYTWLSNIKNGHNMVCKYLQSDNYPVIQEGSSTKIPIRLVKERNLPVDNGLASLTIYGFDDIVAPEGINLSGYDYVNCPWQCYNKLILFPAGPIGSCEFYANPNVLVDIRIYDNNQTVISGHFENVLDIEQYSINIRTGNNTGIVFIPDKPITENTFKENKRYSLVIPEGAYKSSNGINPRIVLTIK